MQAGETWDDVVAYCVAGLAGVECLSGIPGSTGATPIQNVGAYGQDVSETIAWVRCMTARRRRSKCWMRPPAASPTAARFKYRDRWTVLAVAFGLTASRSPADPLRRAGAGARRADGLPRGARRGPRRGPAAAPREGHGDRPGRSGRVSAGSFFTNPILGPGEWAAIQGDPPGWPEPDGRVKTSAAWLIGRAGFERGYGNGHAGISPSTRSR